MTVYFDTSSFIKLYVAEEGSDAVHGLIGSREEPTSSAVLHVELRGALGLIHRAAHMDSISYTTAVETFEADWRNAVKVPVTDAVLGLAGDG